jgi:hypothetical protein
MRRYAHLTIEYETTKIHKAELLNKIREALRYEGFGACIIESTHNNQTIANQEKVSVK